MNNTLIVINETNLVRVKVSEFEHLLEFSINTTKIKS